MGRYGLGLAVAGSVTLLIGILGWGRGAVYLTDYVVILDTPVFYLEYALFIGGILTTVVNFLLTVARRKRPIGAVTGGMVAAAGCTVIAVLALLTALVSLRFRSAPAGADGYAFFQALFYGWGHALQYAYVIAMVVCWSLIAAVALNVSPGGRRVWQAGFMLYVLLALPIPVLYLVLEPLRVPQVQTVTLLLSEGMSLPTLINLGVIVVALWKARQTFVGDRRRLFWKRPPVPAGLFSLLMIGFGGLLQPAGAQGTLRVPAHYHAMVVGGVTMAFMGIAYHFLALVRRKLHSPTMARLQPYLLGVGVLVLSAAMAWAGALDAPRKTFDAGVTDTAWLTPMNLLGLGGVLAALGDAAFVLNVAVSLLGARRDTTVPAALEGERGVVASSSWVE